MENGGNLLPRNVMMQKLEKAKKQMRLLKEKEAAEKARNETIMTPSAYNSINSNSFSDSKEKLIRRSAMQEQMFSISVAQNKNMKNHSSSFESNTSESSSPPRQRLNSAHRQDRRFSNNSMPRQRHNHCKPDSIRYENHKKTNGYSQDSANHKYKSTSMQHKNYDVQEKQSYGDSRYEMEQNSTYNQQKPRYPQSSSQTTPRPTPKSFSFTCDTPLKSSETKTETTLAFSLLKDRPVTDPYDSSFSKSIKGSLSSSDSFKSALEDPTLKDSVYSKTQSNDRKSTEFQNNKLISASIRKKLLNNICKKPTDNSQTDNKRDIPYFWKSDKPKKRLSIDFSPTTDDSDFSDNFSSPQNKSYYKKIYNDPLFKPPMKETTSITSDESDLTQSLPKNIFQKRENNKQLDDTFKISSDSKFSCNSYGFQRPEKSPNKKASIHSAKNVEEFYHNRGKIETINWNKINDIPELGSIDCYPLECKKQNPPNSILNEKAMKPPTYFDSECSGCNLDYLSDTEILLDEKQTTSQGLLHLKAPVGSSRNPDEFYLSHGTMEPIDWSEVTNVKPSNDDHPGVIPNRNREPNELLEKYAANKPDAIVEAKEFLNFVDNTTTYKTIFETRGNLNINPRAMEDPIAKIQRLINEKYAWNVCYLPKELQTLFKENLQKSSNVTQVIDYTQARMTTKSLPTVNIEIPKNRSRISKKKLGIDDISKASKHEKQLENNEKKASELICKKSDDKKKDYFTEYTDDMFEFDIPKSMASLLAAKAVEIQSNKSHYKTLPEHFDKEQKIESIKAQSEKLLESSDIIEKGADSTLLNSTLDSDDLSILRVNELDTSSSITAPHLSSKSFQVPTSKKCSKFQGLISKLGLSKNVEPKLIVSMDEFVRQPNEEQVVATSNKSQSFRENKCIDYVSKCNTDSIIEDKTILIEEIKIRREEEFLRPVSTRYFKQALVEKQENIQILKEHKQEKKVVHSDIYQRIKEISSNKSNLSSIKEKENHLNVSHRQVEVKCEIEQKSNDTEIKETNEPEKIISDVEKIQLDKNTKISDKTDKYLDLIETNIEIKDFNDKQDDTIEKNHKVQQPKQIFSDSTDNDSDYLSDGKSSVIIKEIQSDSEIEKIQDSSHLSKIKHVTEYESVDSDEEFDFVNFENFVPLKELVGNLQKAQSTLVDQIGANREDMAENKILPQLPFIKEKSHESVTLNLFSKNTNIFENVKFNINEVEKGVTEYRETSISDVKIKQKQEITAPAPMTKKHKQRIELLKKMEEKKHVKEEIDNIQEDKNEKSDKNKSLLSKIMNLNLSFS